MRLIIIWQVEAVVIICGRSIWKAVTALLAVSLSLDNTRTYSSVACMTERNVRSSMNRSARSSLAGETYSRCLSLAERCMTYLAKNTSEEDRRE